MNNNKNPLVAFLLSFIPGAGHAYLGRPFRTLLYGGGFFGPLAMILLLLVTGSGFDEIGMLLFFFAVAVAFINMIDMIFSLLSGSARKGDGTPPPYPPAGEAGEEQYYWRRHNAQREKTNTIVLSIIPGLGHMSSGFMQRGITFMIAFVGLFAVILFLSIVMNSGAMLIFLLALPIIWTYCLFDAVQLLNRKERGEPVEDRPVFADLEAHFTSGKKSRVLAMMLSFFPGAGHLYLGLQKRGLQLMAGFLIAVYLMDSMRLTLFLFMIPLIICFAFFDAIHQLSRYERNAQVDEPLISVLVPYQKWLGFGLLGFGIYYLLDRVVADIAAKYALAWYQTYIEIKYMIPTAIVAFIMIAIGMRLLFGERSGGTRPIREEEEG